MSTYDKRAIGVIFAISAGIILFLFWLIYYQDPKTTTWDLSFLPATNALFNAISTVAIATGIILIKKNKIGAHIASMILATFSSAIFLVGYLLHHTYNGDTKFVGEDWIKYYLYFPILISHILLSMAVVPLVFTTLFFSISRRFESHKKWAKWTFPIWLYVSVTGVVVFVFLRFLNQTA